MNTPGSVVPAKEHPAMEPIAQREGVERVQVAIVGSGPAGLSCAARAARRGLSHVLLEAQGHPCNTIHRYQKGKHVMAEPSVLPLRSDLSFSASRRETVLDTWQEELRELGVELRTRATVARIEGHKGAFRLQTQEGACYEAEQVVLAIGMQGNLRRLEVPGDDLPGVQYHLDDPQAHADEVIVVVGTGDAGIENALALAERNRVILLNRGDEFSRAKPQNSDAVLAAAQAGRLEIRYNVRPTRVAAAPGAPDAGWQLHVRCRDGVDVIGCDRIVARLGAVAPRALVEGFGIAFTGPSSDALPRLSERYESSVAGLYVIGALAGYPLIKQALNQGYEVVETLIGRPVEPADEPLLRERFRPLAHIGTMDQVLQHVQDTVALFRGLSRLQLREFMLDSEVLSPAQGSLVFSQGDYTNSFYSILAGEVLIELGADVSAGPVRLGPGQHFGEMGLLSGRRRSRTVRAGAGCVLIETPRRSMLRMMALSQEVRLRVDQISLRRVIRGEIAPYATEGELDQLTAASRTLVFPAGHPLFEEGDEADGLYLIRRGSVMVLRRSGGKEAVLSYVAAGNFVGEMALLSADNRRTATVRAAVDTEVVLLERATFRAVMADNPQMRERLQAASLQRVARNVQAEAHAEPGDLISFLVGQGLGEGTDVLLIDESLCVRCDHCERACADTHDGTSRLDREAGPTFANVHVPTSCRHCENPHCMKDCPPDAIRRGPGGEVVINDSCIGCGNCQRNCPYGVIQMAPHDPDWRPPNLLAWLLTGWTREPGRSAPAASPEHGLKAVKCDMCAGLKGGPACVRACPTGAAVRVSPEKFMGHTRRPR